MNRGIFKERACSTSNLSCAKYVRLNLFYVRPQATWQKWKANVLTIKSVHLFRSDIRMEFRLNECRVLTFP